MNIENKFNVGDKVFICANLNKLHTYINIDALFEHGELCKQFRDMLNNKNKMKENVKTNIIEVLKIKEAEIRGINIYIEEEEADKPKISYEVDYSVYPYELEENKIYRTKEEALAAVEAEIKNVFKLRETINEKINNVENLIFEFHETVNKY